MIPADSNLEGEADFWPLPLLCCEEGGWVNQPIGPKPMSARISKTLGLQALNSMILERERERENYPHSSSVIHHG